MNVTNVNTKYLEWDKKRNSFSENNNFIEKNDIFLSTSQNKTPWHDISFTLITYLPNIFAGTNIIL